MPAIIPLRVLAAVLVVITGASINILGTKMPEKKRCLRICGLDKKVSLAKRLQILNSVQCYWCLRGRPAKPTFKEKTLQRRKRSTFSNDCPGRVKDVTVPEEQFVSRSNINVSFGRYENTENWFADVSWNPLKDTNNYLKEHLIRLSVGSQPDLLCTVVPKNQTSLMINISQHGYQYPNPIELLILSIPHNIKDAISMDYFYNIQLASSKSPPITSTKTEKATRTTAIMIRTTFTTSEKTTNVPSSKSPPSTSTMTVKATRTTATTTRTGLASDKITDTRVHTKMATQDSKRAINYVFISAGIIASALIGILVIAFRRKSVFRPQEHVPVSAGSENTLSSSSGAEGNELVGPRSESYVFIMFNNGDCEWMKNKLLDLLENQHQFKCRVHYRDFEPGGVFYDTMSNSVYTSYKNIAVYSNNFLNSTHCWYELEQAEQRLLVQNDNSLVIIRIDGADLRKLPRTLRSRSVIDYDSNHEQPYWEKRLLQFLKVPVAERSVRKIATVMVDRPAASGGKNGQVITHYSRLDSTKSDDTVISSV